MALTVRWTPIALADLENAFEFISADKPRAAAATIATIQSCLKQLKAFPETGRAGRVKGTRELVASPTPYIIIYRSKDSCLEILAVLHSARKG